MNLGQLGLFIGEDDTNNDVWCDVISEVVGNLRRGFEKSFYDGRLKCETISTVYDAANRLAVPWISERFGHMCCYYGRCTASKPQKRSTQPEI